MSNRAAAALAGAGLTLAAALGVWYWTLDPANGPRRWFPILFLVLAWGWAEWAQGPAGARRLPILKWHRIVFATMGLLLALKMSARIAVELEVMGASWVPVARRGFGAILGGLLVVWGNYLPKLVSPWPVEEQPFDWQRVHRFVGWLATLTGLGTIVVWLTLPIATANELSAALMLTFVLLAIGSKLISVATRPRRRPPVES